MLNITKMTCYNKKLRQTRPEQLNNFIVVPVHSRVNGWSLPLHSFQLITLLLYSYLAIVGFGIYIPLLPTEWKNVAYAVIGIIFVHHLITHLVAVTIDPADQNILAEKNYAKPMPIFDRSKCKHVIQNQHCYLCEADVGPKTKHCSTCNKCIENFDHHCNWLNNCVGSRNYWFFFNAIVSAVAGSFLMIVVILYVFVQFFVDPAQLRTSPQFENFSRNDTWLAFLPIAPVEMTATGILAIATFSVLLGGASFLMLGHLLLFHLYLFFKDCIHPFPDFKIFRGGPSLGPIAIMDAFDGNMREGLLCGCSQVVECLSLRVGKNMNTYEYVTQYRPKQSTKSGEMSEETASAATFRMEPLPDLSQVRKPDDVTPSSISGTLPSNGIYQGRDNEQPSFSQRILTV